jgi:hypothetical protein
MSWQPRATPATATFSDFLPELFSDFSDLAGFAVLSAVALVESLAVVVLLSDFLSSVFFSALLPAPSPLRA